nr:MAG TPA_asm: hypothetical protein [Caudoviricetes sp.]
MFLCNLDYTSYRKLLSQTKCFCMRFLYKTI